jgi:hypothetical protein
MVCVLAALPGTAQATNRGAPAQTTMVKGQSCGNLWLQQAQFPFTTATLVQSDLAEIDGTTGDVVQSVGLCGGSWSQPQFQADPDHVTISYEKDFLFDGSEVTFTFTVNAFNQSTTVPDQGQQVQFPSGSVTYAVAMSGWPFLNFDDTLQLKDTTTILTSAVKQAHMTQSPAALLPQTAQVDGNTLPIDLHARAVASGRGLAITLSFPDFGQLSYNPLPASTTSSGS